MLTALSAIARMLLRVFVATVAVYALGVLAAPDLDTARTVAIAGIVAGFAAVLRAVSVYVPLLTVAHYVRGLPGKLADAFIHAFLAALLANWADLITVPHFHGWRDLYVAAIVGAFGVAVRAVQGLLTPGEAPAPTFGLPEPRPSRGTAPVGAPPPD